MSRPFRLPADSEFMGRWHIGFKRIPGERRLLERWRAVPLGPIATFLHATDWAICSLDNSSAPNNFVKGGT